MIDFSNAKYSSDSIQHFSSVSNVINQSLVRSTLLYLLYMESYCKGAHKNVVNNMSKAFLSYR